MTYCILSISCYQACGRPLMTVLIQKPQSRRDVQDGPNDFITRLISPDKWLLCFWFEISWVFRWHNLCLRVKGQSHGWIRHQDNIHFGRTNHPTTTVVAQIHYMLVYLSLRLSLWYLVFIPRFGFTCKTFFSGIPSTFFQTYLYCFSLDLHCLSVLFLNLFI